jgi:hypothetical protein
MILVLPSMYRGNTTSFLLGSGLGEIFFHALVSGCSLWLWDLPIVKYNMNIIINIRTP